MLREGLSVREVAASLQVQEGNIRNWRVGLGLPPLGKPKGRKIEPVEEIGGRDLSFPDPVIEAKGCLKIALANGGVEKMRALIQISDQERRELEQMQWTGQLSEMLVNKSLEYRAQVLLAFDCLVAKNANRIGTTEQKALAAGAGACQSTDAGGNL
jgi:hypothetical protein